MKLIRYFLIICGILAVTGSAHAQSNVAIALGATYAGGAAQFSLLNPQGYTGTLQPSPQTAILLDASGAATITTLGTGVQYAVKACKSTGLACLLATVNVDGTAQDITTSLQAYQIPTSVAACATCVTAAAALTSGKVIIGSGLQAQSASKVTLTNPATTATITVADNKTLTVSNTLTFTGTDSSSVAVGAGGTVSYAAVQNCGTLVACANTAVLAPKLVFGTAAFTSGTPSTATLTALPFTATGSYVCTVTEASDATKNLIKVANASASSTVITGPNTITDTVGFICAGS